MAYPNGHFRLYFSTGAAIALLCLTALVLGSCTTRGYRRQKRFSDVLHTGRYLEGVAEIREHPRLYGALNRFLYWYDQGLLYHYGGRFDSSTICLQRAETELDRLYARSIANEAASLLTNDNIRPYRARRYEQVLLHQFLSFDYLARRQYDEALVETRKVQLVFDRFAEKDRRDSSYTDDGMSHFVSALVYKTQGEVDNALVSLYKSVAAYRTGPVPLPAAVSAYAYRELMRGGREQDVEQLGIAPADTASLDAGGGNAEIVLIGYAGKGPVLAQSRFRGTYIVGGMFFGSFLDPAGDTVAFHMPAPSLPAAELEKAERGEKTKAGTTFSVSFALPVMAPRESKTAGFYASVDSATSRRSAALTNIERLLEQDLEDRRPVTLARTAVRVVLRTIAAQRAKREMRSDSPGLNLLVNLGTDVLADQLEQADTRLSIFMPRTIHIIRIPVAPGEHRVDAAAVGADGAPIDRRSWERVVVAPGEKRFLFYPSLR